MKEGLRARDIGPGGLRRCRALSPEACLQCSLPAGHGGWHSSHVIHHVGDKGMEKGYYRWGKLVKGEEWVRVEDEPSVRAGDSGNTAA